MIRILVLPAAFSNAANERSVVLAPFISDLEESGKASFTFIDGPVTVDRDDPKHAKLVSEWPAAPNRRWWHYDLPMVSQDAPRAYDFHSAAKAIETVRSAWYSLGPFDALMGYSEGGAMIAALLYEEFFRQKTTADSPILKALRGAIFISAPSPIVADPPRDPSASGKLLSANDYGHMFDTRTLHIFGSRDPGRVRIRELMRLCNPNKATFLDTGCSHSPPPDSYSIGIIKEAIATFVEDLSPSGYRVRTVAPSDAPTKSRPARYNLTDVDAVHIPENNFGYLFFPLGVDSDTQRISAALEVGLAETLAQIPMLVGRICSDDHSHPYVIRRPEDTCKLGIRYLEDSFPSFEVLKENYFNTSMLPSALLMSQRPKASGTQRLDNDGVPGWFVQANFVRGGFILAIGFHRQVADAWSCDMFLNLLADNTRVALSKRAPDLKKSFELDIDRSPFWRKRPDQGTTNALERYVHKVLPSLSKAFENGDIGTSAARVTPEKDVVGLLLCLPREKADALKQQCTPSPPAFVSTYDCVSSLLFRSLTRARLQTGRIRPDEATLNLHQVNVRGRSNEVHKSYFGNAVAASVSSSVSAAEVVADGGLQKAALATRRAIQATDAERLRNNVELASQLGPNKTSETLAAFRATGLLQASWQQLRLDTYDLGFGPPRAFRTPGSCTEGAAVLFPTLPEENIVARLEADAGCIEVMEQDPELRAYADVLTTEVTAA